MKLAKSRRPNVKSIEHNPNTEELTVHFHSGASYRYSGVDAMKAAKIDGGAALHQHIIGQHDATRLPAPKSKN